MSYYKGQFTAFGRLYRASEYNIEWRRELAGRLKLEADAGFAVVLWVHGHGAARVYPDFDDDELIDALIASGGVAFVSELNFRAVETCEIEWVEGSQAIAVAGGGRVVMLWTEADDGDSVPEPHLTILMLERQGVCVVHELSSAAKERLFEGERAADAEKEMALSELRDQKRRIDQRDALEAARMAPETISPRAKAADAVTVSARTGVTAKPDWLPEKVAAELNDSDNDKKRGARMEALMLACDILYPSYRARLVQLVPPKLAPGVPFTYVMPINFLRASGYPCATMSVGTLELLGKKLAEDSIDAAVYEVHKVWAHDSAGPLVGDDDERRYAVEGMLLDALDELADGQAAANCVKVWLDVAGLVSPPNWKAVDELIRRSPDLVTIGARSMSARGFVLPPWMRTSIV